MRENVNRPNKDDHDDFANGLPNELIDKVFYWTLIGANYENYHYQGIIQSLKHYLAELADEKFEPYQLIALISMTYHAPSLTSGPGLHARLKELLEKITMALYCWKSLKHPIKILI